MLQAEVLPQSRHVTMVMIKIEIEIEIAIMIEIVISTWART